MATTTVRTLDELYQALSQANGGDTIALAAGNYGDLVLKSKGDIDFTFPSNVTLTSADPSNPAVFSGMELRDASNLTFDGITFDYKFESGDQIYGRPFNVTSSDNITIRNSTFDGDVAQGVSVAADGYGFGIGLSFSDSSGITVENNEVFNFHRGVTITRSNDVEVLRNDVHTITSDGMNFSQIDTVLIEGNYLHDFNASPTSLSHRDMIQFWTNGTTEPSRDITITGNHLDIGEGSFTQSIFMRNDQVDLGKAGTEMFYQNVEITDNVIVNGHRHGINVGETNGVAISNNSVLHADGDSPDGLDRAVEIPRIAVAEASTNVSISQNITSSIGGWTNQADWQISNNAFVQDQNASDPGYYGDVFVATSLQAADGMHNFVALPGGMADRLDAGAPATLAGVQNNALAASFHIETQENNPAVRTFDARTTLIDGDALPEGTTYVWDFGDGQTGTGQRTTHSYSDGGNYDVTLTIRLPNGSSDRIETTMEVAGSELLDMRTDGHFTNHEAGTQQAVNVGGMATPEGLRLGVGNETPTVDRQYVDRLTQTDEFRIDLSLQADRAGDGGEVFRLHGTMVTTVTDAGDVTVMIKQDDGETVKLMTAGGNVTDTASHDISITLQGGVLSVAIDGTIRATATDIGKLHSEDTQDLVFGNPWGKDSFDGMLTDFSISTDESDYGPTFTQPTPPPAAPAPEDDAPLTLADLDLDLDIDFGSEPEAPVATAQPNIPDGAVALAGLGVSARLDRDDVDFLPGADAFDISMRIQADSAGSSGEVFRLQGSLLASVNDQGDLVVRAFTTDGIRTRVVSEGADLGDGEEHEISISMADGMLSIQVDDGPLSTTEVFEPLGDRGNNDLMFGNPQGRDNFEGVLLSFDASAPAAAGAPEGPSVSLDAVNHSAAPTMLDGILAPTSDTQKAAPSKTRDEDGMEAESGPFDLYYHDLSYFYSG